MTTAAEQYRKLVAKLESINPSEPVNEAPVAAFGQTVDAPPADAATAPLAGSVAVDPAPAPEVNPAPAPTGEIPTLPGTFKQAYAQAVKQGLTQFKWCGTYSTRRGQAPNPKPAPTSNVQPRLLGQGPSDAIMKDKYGRPIPKASQDLIRQSYNDSAAGV
jgi:hypothetical protein